MKEWPLVWSKLKKSLDLQWGFLMFNFGDPPRDGFHHGKVIIKLAYC